MLDLAVLISGEGSNLQAIIDAIAQEQLDARIRVVISNKATARGLLRSQKAGIPTATVEHQQFSSRESFDRELIRILDPYAVDLIVLAGFMRILSPVFIAHFASHILNIHPSLLPRHKGLHTHHRVLEAKDQTHGCSVHCVTAGLDEGPVLAQAILQVLPGEDEGQLQQRVHQLEHQLYPLVLQTIAQGTLNLKDTGHAKTLYFQADSLLRLHPVTSVP